MVKVFNHPSHTHTRTTRAQVQPVDHFFQSKGHLPGMYAFRTVQAKRMVADILRNIIETHVELEVTPVPRIGHTETTIPTNRFADFPPRHTLGYIVNSPR